MGLMIDLVPNHMGVLKADNRWWLDVLEHGPASRYADCFDIDWTPMSDELRGKVLLPILGDQYGTVLERGEIELRFDGDAGAFSLWYFEHRLPDSTEHLPGVLLEIGGPAGDEDVVCSSRCASTSRALPARAAPGCDATTVDDDPGAAAQASAGGSSARARRPCAAPSKPRRGGSTARRATPASFDALHELIKLQFYRLVVSGAWPPTTSTIGAFSTSTTWPRCATERPGRVRGDAPAHLRMDGRRQGRRLRIDHPDGLLRSARSISRRLQERAGAALARRPRPRRLRRTRARSISCWKRSSPITSACRSTGRFTGPPATAS